MSFFSSQIARLESFGYVGRENFGALKIAVCILILGLFIGALGSAGSDDGLSEKQKTESSIKIGSDLPNTPKQTIEFIPTSTPKNVTGLNNAEDKQRSLVVRNGDTLMSIMLAEVLTAMKHTKR